MTQPRLTAEFQPCATDGSVGMETITHSGPSITIDLTAYVLGMTPQGVQDLHDRAYKVFGKDLDHVAEAVPGLVEGNAGDGGYDMLLESEDIDAFFESHGMKVADLSHGDLTLLREEYGTEPGAAPMLASDVPAAPGPR